MSAHGQAISLRRVRAIKTTQKCTNGSGLDLLNLLSWSQGWRRGLNTECPFGRAHAVAAIPSAFNGVTVLMRGRTAQTDLQKSTIDQWLTPTAYQEKHLIWILHTCGTPYFQVGLSSTPGPLVIPKSIRMPFEFDSTIIWALIMRSIVVSRALQAY